MMLLDALKSPAARVPHPQACEPGIRELPDPAQVMIPLEYHNGLLLAPQVKAGDQVARGQVIGRSEGGNCLHASIGGLVREIKPIWTAGGRHVPAVVIDRDETPDLTPSEALRRCHLNAGSATRIQLLMAGGVLSPWTTPAPGQDESRLAERPDIRHLVLLGHDEEPTQHVQELLLQERAASLDEGLHLLRDVAPQAAILLTVPRRLVGWARETFGPELRVVGVSDEYRRRLVRVLMPQLTGVHVPADAPYRSHGIAVMTVEAALAAQDALTGRPWVRKTLTLSGLPFDRPLTVSVPLGTSVRSVLAACGADSETAGRVLAGGPMCGTALYTDSTPIDKHQHGIHLLGAGELSSEVNLNCVNCGRCVRACPSHIQVHLIGRCVEFNLMSEAGAHHPEACFECGLCAYVCPARRPLVQLVKLAKSQRRKSS